MSDLWRSLDIRDSFSFLPLGKYLKAHDLTAIGDADGFVKKVFPHLQIDIQRIHEAEGIDGTFNVCNFGRKTNEVIPHDQLNIDLLVASVSLPFVLPPVRIGGDLYLDSAFIRDANLMEAVRRGADELWVVWCLGNTSEYRGGPLNIYVQVLETAANGALFEEFDRINELNARIEAGETPYGHERPIRLHLIRPDPPYP